jgi:hypothetical protein
LCAIGQFGAAGAVVEAPTEIAQQMMERAQAGLPLDSEDAIAEYIEAGVLGGIIGAGVGGGLGAVRGPEAPPAPPLLRPLLRVLHLRLLVLLRLRPYRLLVRLRLLFRQ